MRSVVGAGPMVLSRLTLATHAEERRRLVTEPPLIFAAVDELLRACTCHHVGYCFVFLCNLGHPATLRSGPRPELESRNGDSLAFSNGL